MGTWGPGNFENDTAADHLHEVCGPLIQLVDDAMNVKDEWSVDDYEHDVVLANLEMLACLGEHLGRYAHGGLSDVLSPRIPMPSKEKLLAWKEKFLADWEAQIDGMNPDADYKQQRREVIRHTFDRVAKLAASEHE